MGAGEFELNLKAIRDRARKHIEDGPVTSGYALDRNLVIKLLNESLATEIVCTLRYRQHWQDAQGMNAIPIAEEFKEHADEEQQHADWIAARISQLGGKPNFNPEGLSTRSHADFDNSDSLTAMITEDLVAERIAIDIYTQMIHFFGDKDPSTRRLIEKILEQEEEHAEDLRNMLKRMPHSPANDLL